MENAGYYSSDGIICISMQFCLLTFHHSFPISLERTSCWSVALVLARMNGSRGLRYKGSFRRNIAKWKCKFLSILTRPIRFGCGGLCCSRCPEKLQWAASKDEDATSVFGGHSVAASQKRTHDLTWHHSSSLVVPSDFIEMQPYLCQIFWVKVIILWFIESLPIVQQTLMVL